MSENTQNLWGYVSDDDPSLKIKSNNVKFGLNQGVTLKRFEYSTKTGAGNTEGNPAIIIEFDVNGTMKNTRIWDPTVANARMYKGGTEILDHNSAEYKAAQFEAVKAVKGLITHYLKASGKTDEQIKAAYANVNSFQSLATVAQSGMQEIISSKKPLDLFLQYQSKISGTATKTYPEIPTTLLGGAFVTTHTAPVGEWKEERDWSEKDEEGNVISKKGLRYVDQAGNVHRFQRDEAFMNSKVGSEQTKNGGVMGGNSPMPVSPQAANPQQGAW